MAVVPVDAPTGQEPLGKAVLARPTDVVHDLLGPAQGDTPADPSGDIVERLVPGDGLPISASSRPDSPQGMQDSFGVIKLIDRRRALGAVAAPRAGVSRVAFQLADGQVRLVDVGEQPAARLAVEARGGDQHVFAGHLARMGPGVVLDVVVPVLHRREAGQLLVPASAGQRDRFAHDSGTSWPARTNTDS